MAKKNEYLFIVVWRFCPLFCIDFIKNKYGYINIKVSLYQITSFCNIMVLS